MDSKFQHDYQHQNQQPNSGLLRFRSAPSSLLSNFTEGGVVASGANKGNFTEGSESEILSRFLNYAGSADAASPTEAAVNHVSSQQGYSGGLPPHYPRYGTAAPTSSPMDGSYGLVGSMATDHHVQAKADNSNILRQSSSPAGLFSHVSIPNGIVLVLITHLIGML